MQPRAPNFFSYRPSQPLSPGQHQVQVEYSNAQGQRRVASWTFTVQNPQPALAISSVTHNATNPLAQDGTLLVTINGTPGVQATALLIEGDVVREIQAQEVSSGVYVASYRPTTSDVSAESIAVGELQRGDQKIFAAATQPVVISASTNTPEVTDTAVGEDPQPEDEAAIALQPTFTSHSDGGEITGRGFTLVGQTRPNARVDITVSVRTPVAGGLFDLGSSQLVDTTVTADTSGEFSLSVSSPLVVTSETRYGVQAQASQGGEVSPTTRLILEQQ